MKTVRNLLTSMLVVLGAFVISQPARAETTCDSAQLMCTTSNPPGSWSLPYNCPDSWWYGICCLGAGCSQPIPCCAQESGEGSPPPPEQCL